MCSTARTGQVLSADPYAYINVYKGVDLQDRPAAPGRREGAESRAGRCATSARPPGRQGLEPFGLQPAHRPALHPAHQPLHGYGRRRTPTTSPARRSSAPTSRCMPGPAATAACSPPGTRSPARKVFEIKEDLPLWSGALATAGGLVFYGTMDGWFKAVDARTGKLLWQFKTGSGIIGQPISYRGPDGRQYIAVPSGVGGWAGAIVSADLDPATPPRARLRQCGQGSAEARLGRRNGLCLRASEIAPSQRRAGAAVRLRPRARDSRGKPLGETVRAPLSPTRSSPAAASRPPLDPRAAAYEGNAYAIAQGSSSTPG